MTNELIKINDNFIVNLSVIYSVQYVLCKNDEAVSEYYGKYNEIYQELYQDRFCELNIGKDLGGMDVVEDEDSYTQLSEDDLKNIKNEIIRRIGDEPESTVWRYILTLNTGKQVLVDEHIFKQIAKYCE